MDGHTSLYDRIEKDPVRAFVVHPFLKADQGKFLRDPEGRLEEACNLTAAIDLDVVDAMLVPLSKQKPSTFIGGGKLDEIAARIEPEKIAVVIVDAALSPVQQRNLEKTLKTKVIDRTGLILEIFGARANTKEGSLQVELAALEFQKTRLVRSWTHLERQRGGLGFIGGPGESQLEIDRRLISERILKIRGDLDKVRRTRDLHRKNRDRVPYPVIALVGYTNAGKSTLFNRLTGAGVMAQDMLFATLDPTMRAIELPSGRKVILSDTVGFISELPTHLVAAFRATLEEVTAADIVLHVQDFSHRDHAAQAADVLQVLDDLGLEFDGDEARPAIDVFNKADLLDDARRQLAATTGARDGRAALVSALDGEGCADLLALIDHVFEEKRTEFDIAFPVSNGKLQAWLHANGEVLSQSVDEQGQMTCQLRMEDKQIGQLAGFADVIFLTPGVPPQAPTDPVGDTGSDDMQPDAGSWQP